MRRARLLALFLVAAVAPAAAPAVARAGTYTFSIPGSAVRLVGPEAGSSPAFRLVPPSTLATQTSATPTYTSGAWARAWLALPGGAVFGSLSGTVRRGGGQVNPPGLWAAVATRAANGISVVAWVDQIHPSYTTSTWSYDGSTTRPTAVGLQLSATAAGACGTCLAALDALSGTIEDTLAPSAVTLASPVAGTFVRTRDVPVTWSVTDAAAGPGDVRVAINGTRTGALLRTAPAANPALLLAQRNAGTDTARGAGTVTLPEADGAYAIQAIGADAVGNEATTAPVTVTLDRTAPTIGVTSAPTSWCSSACRVDVRVADALSGVGSVAATVAGAPVPVDAVGASAASIDRSIDLGALEVQGRVTVIVTATDGAGNTAQVEVPIALDDLAPAVASATADPATRQVLVDVEDISGLQTARARIDGRELTLGPVGPPRLGLQMYGVAVPTDGFPEVLDDRSVDVRLLDAAGNATTTTTTFRHRAVPVPVARLFSKRITYGRRVLATGRVAGEGLADGTPITITLSNRRWPSYTRTWRTTLRGGRFALRVKPTMNGVLRAHLPGSAELQPVTITLGHVAVRPTIKARFTALRLPSGLYGNIRARGRFQPAGGPPVTLAWQAQSPRSKRWFAICRADDAIAPGATGRFVGRCRLAGLPAGVRIRVGIGARSGSPYLVQASRAETLG